MKPWTRLSWHRIWAQNFQIGHNQVSRAIARSQNFSNTSQCCSFGMKWRPAIANPLSAQRTRRYSTTRFDSVDSDDEIGSHHGVTFAIFNMLRDDHKDTINLGKFLQGDTEYNNLKMNGRYINNFAARKAIEHNGIRRSDPRLSQVVATVEKLHRDHGKSDRIVGHLDVDFDTFQRIIEGNIVFLAQIFRNKLVLPEFETFCEEIRSIYEKCKQNRDGKVASYIPQLARYDPDIWACSVCTVDGQRFSLGDVNTAFTLQSCSKPFTYAICLNELGPEIVHNYVSHEPSGRNFNAICLDAQDKPHNPMLNSGAIMISALSLRLLNSDMRLAEKFDFMQNYLKRLAGYENIGFNNAVFLSERETADRNFAMAYFLKEHKCFPKNTNLLEVMDLYFQFCSLEVATDGLAVMGATLANGGICPTTGEQILSPDTCRDVLSLMYSCGMYNYSGQFAFQVGLPAKSGVSGCLVLVIPNVMSIALWSPPLDVIGNSVRGLQFCKELVNLFNFHRFDNLRYSQKKLDPRRHQHEAKGLSNVTLLFAASSGDVTALKRHYLQGVDLNQGDYDGRTALHVAAAEGQKECVNFLLETAEVSASPKDRWGFTPLEEAIRFQHPTVAEAIENACKRQTKADQ